MNRKGPQKHSKEIIQTAIARCESGARLSAIARELGVEKSTVKYWLDNASKFLPESGPKNHVEDRIKKRLARESWDVIFASIKVLKKKLSDATPKELVYIISELFDRQAQIGALSGSLRMPDRVMEVSEEVKITVQRFLEKKSTEKPLIKDDAEVADGEVTDITLGGAPLEQNISTSESGGTDSLIDAPAQENGANG